MEDVRPRATVHPGDIAGDRPIVLYDGTCALCEGSVRFIGAHSDPGAFVFLPRADPAAHRALEGHPAAAAIDGVILIDGGRAYATSDAAVRIAARLRGPWRMAAGLGLVPRVFREAAYAVVARNRFRWFGRRRLR